MKYFLLFLLCIFFSCSSINQPITVTKNNGDLNYSSLIGSTWYCDENLASIFDDLTYSNRCIEKWKFYADSIIVIATHYDLNFVATNQYKYVAELSQMDRVFKDSDGDTWRTTTSWWKQYSSSGCDWLDIISQQTGPFNIIVNDRGQDEIGFGSFESNAFYKLTKVPSRITYPARWYPFDCGYTIQ